MAITFEQYQIDLKTLACERLIAEFNSSETGIQPYLNALVTQTQDWNDISQTVFSGRFLDNAIGVQLDIIGRIVGQSRPFLSDGDTIVFFQFDQISESTGWDSFGTWFSTNSPTTGLIPANDATYRRFIQGKIFKNQVTGASPPEQLQFIKTTLNLDASIFSNFTEPASIVIGVPGDTPPQFKSLLLSFTTDSTVEKDYFVPIAVGVRLVGLLLFPPGKIFGFDADKNNLFGWDSGSWAIGVS